jgi:hypothetical protein
MYRVKWLGNSGVEKCLQFPNLAAAMQFSKTLNRFVVITDGVTEIVGKFGVDSVKDGVCPDGVKYTWVKRRKVYA